MHGGTDQWCAPVCYVSVVPTWACVGLNTSHLVTITVWCECLTVLLPIHAGDFTQSGSHTPSHFLMQSWYTHLIPWMYTLHYIPTLTPSSANPICTGEQCRAKLLGDTQYCYICYQYTLLSSVENSHVHRSWGIRRTKLPNHNSVSVTRVALLPGPAQLIKASSKLSRAWERGYKKRSANISAQHICSISCIAILNS